MAKKERQTSKLASKGERIDALADKSQEHKTRSEARIRKNERQATKRADKTQKPAYEQRTELVQKKLRSKKEKHKERA